MDLELPQPRAIGPGLHPCARGRPSGQPGRALRPDPGPRCPAPGLPRAAWPLSTDRPGRWLGTSDAMVSRWEPALRELTPRDLNEPGAPAPLQLLVVEPTRGPTRCPDASRKPTSPRGLGDD